MNVSEVMSPNVEWIKPDMKLSDAAVRMRDLDVGMLPIGDGERLVGVITDRDIVVRSVAESRSASETPVSDAMSDKVLYLYEDQDVNEAAKSMADNAVRRMPVVDRDKNLKGVVSLGDLAKKGSETIAGDTLQRIFDAP